MPVEAFKTLLQEGVAAGVFPGAVALGALGGDVVLHEACGSANLFAQRPVTTATLFDLASLTKPLATTAAVMHLFSQGMLSPDTPLGHLIMDFRTTDKAGLTIRQLLTHQSGLPAYMPYYKRLQCLRPADRVEHLKALLVAEPLCCLPGERTVYSDLGFMVLAWVVEQCCGMPMAQYLRRVIYGPLGLERLYFPTWEKVPSGGRIAASEYSAWRGRLIDGSVHDDNADAAGALQGHAGLFGDALSAHRLLAAMLAAYHGDTNGFEPRIVRQFWTKPSQGGRALGFDVPAAVGSACGNFFSPHTVGHLGFTGTSFWVDVERRAIVVLLTNRIHPFAGNNRIRAFRPVFHDATMQCLGLAS